MTAVELRSDFIALVAQHLRKSSAPVIGPVADRMQQQDCRRFPLSSTHAPVCAHLDAAVALFPVGGTAGAIAGKLRELLPELRWVADYPQHPVLKAAFGHAVIAASDEFVMGCNLLAAGTDYPAHWHPADEIYIPLSGSGALYWQERSGKFEARASGDIILHGAREAHAMTTRDHPVLNLWIQFGEHPGGPAWFV